MDIDLPAVTDTCPSTLRTALNAWKAGKLTHAGLVDASRMAQLDLLDEYRFHPMPTPPEPVHMLRERPRDYDDSAVAELHRKYGGFFREEDAARSRNHLGRYTLHDLLDWAQAKPLPAPMLDRIRLALATYEDRG